MNFIYLGRCWKFGDDIGVDGDLMPLEFAIQRETRIEILSPNTMKGIDPTFAGKAKPGDIMVGGKRFAQGNPHIQGLLGIAGLKMGLVVESIPRGSLRNSVNAGLPILPSCPDVGKHCETGDELEVDFATGRFFNKTRGETLQFEPLDQALRDIIALGGQKPALQKRIAAMAAR
ncbi:MAG: 3-isopropylmalate/(R)-2-methylmalate dehydratase small subunit [Betaproteobacteria bacterium]|nr:3-isopropylmalate/(R)-2-methylmalate dehydratase small subunit [Betaproteobacteria bacterium]